jgi:hypothetical protein
MMTVLLDSPGSVTQLFPAASGTGTSPSGESLSCSHPRAFFHTGPHPTRCAPCGVEVSVASSRRSVMTVRALRYSASLILSYMRAEDSTPRSVASTKSSCRRSASRDKVWNRRDAHGEQVEPNGDELLGAWRRSASWGSAVLS